MQHFGYVLFVYRQRDRCTASANNTAWYFTLKYKYPTTPYIFTFWCSINPYCTEGYSWLVSNYATCDYSRNQSNCSTMPSVTIVA